MSAFQDKVAIVTGGASGIGRAVAQALARAGAEVVLADIQLELAETTAAAIRQAGGRASAAKLDVRDAAAVKQLIEGVAAKHGRLDFLFNNAGVAVVAEVRDLTLDDWRFQMDVNLNGVVHGVVAAYPIMVRQGFGHIVNTASLAGLCPSPGLTPYAMTKHAVVGLSISLRVEGHALGVKVSAVCPGVIDTPILRSRFVALDADKTRKAITIKALPPDKCAAVILRGVAKNRPIIPVTGAAWFSWLVYRLSPRLVIALCRLMVNKLRQGRTSAPAKEEPIAVSKAS